MIIVPEIQIVVILTPRTGTGSLRRALAARYPKAMRLYSHMEADGVPHGYDRWRKVGVVRDPVERLWSLYKFCRTISGKHDPVYMQRMRESTQLPFSEWILRNRDVFVCPYDLEGGGRSHEALYTTRHQVPENCKSQFVYLRPDLGTEVFQYSNLQPLARTLDIEYEDERKHQTEPTPAPSLTREAQAHMTHWFAWDFTAVRSPARRPAMAMSRKSSAVRQVEFA